MERPQFTLRTMLISVSYLALAFGLFRWALLDLHGAWGVWIFVFSFAPLGAGIGALFNQQLAGAITAVVIAVCILFGLTGGSLIFLMTN